MAGLPHEFRAVRAYAEEGARMMSEAHPALSEEEERLRGVYIGKWGDNR